MRLALEIDRSDLFASTIADDGCCKLIIRDQKTGAIVTDKVFSPPAVATSPMDATGYAAAAVRSTPGARVVGTHVVGGEVATFVDGLQSNGIPSAAVFMTHHGVVYTITALGYPEVSADQGAVISSIQFTN